MIFFVAVCSFTDFCWPFFCGCEFVCASQVHLSPEFEIILNVYIHSCVFSVRISRVNGSCVFLFPKITNSDFIFLLCFLSLIFLSFVFSLAHAQLGAVLLGPDVHLSFAFSSVCLSVWVKSNERKRKEKREEEEKVFVCVVCIRRVMIASITTNWSAPGQWWSLPPTSVCVLLEKKKKKKENER